MSYYGDLLPKLGFKNHVAKQAAGETVSAGYMKDGVIVMVMVVNKPDTNMSLENGQSFPPGTQGIVIDVNKAF